MAIESCPSTSNAITQLQTTSCWPRSTALQLAASTVPPSVRLSAASAAARTTRRRRKIRCANMLFSTQLSIRDCRVLAVSNEACDEVSGLSPYVAAVAAGCLGMPSTRCSASHRATDSYTAATARPPALRHEHTTRSP